MYVANIFFLRLFPCGSRKSTEQNMAAVLQLLTTAQPPPPPNFPTSLTDSRVGTNWKKSPRSVFARPRSVSFLHHLSVRALHRPMIHRERERAPCKTQTTFHSSSWTGNYHPCTVLCCVPQESWFLFMSLAFSIHRFSFRLPSEKQGKNSACCLYSKRSRWGGILSRERGRE